MKRAASFRISEKEDPEQLPERLLHDKSRQIQHRIYERQDIEAAGEHGAENGKSVKRHSSHRGKGNPLPDQRGRDPGVQHPPCRQRGEKLSRQQRQKAGKIRRKENRLPPDGKRIDHPAGAGIIQITVHRHDGDDRGRDRQFCRSASAFENIAEHLSPQNIRFATPGVDPVVHRQGEGQHQQSKPACPQRPAAQQQVAADAFMKEARFRLHDPSLPVHK